VSRGEGGEERERELTCDAMYARSVDVVVCGVW
jgi:hypothetical protein